MASYYLYDLLPGCYPSLINVVGGNQALPWDCEEAFHRLTHGRLRCDKMVYLGGNLPLGFQCLISLHPAIEEVQLCSQATTKASVQSFCFILKLSPFYKNSALNVKE